MAAKALGATGRGPKTIAASGASVDGAPQTPFEEALKAVPDTAAGKVVHPAASPGAGKAREARGGTNGIAMDSPAKTDGKAAPDKIPSTGRITDRLSTKPGPESGSALAMPAAHDAPQTAGNIPTPGTRSGPEAPLTEPGQRRKASGSQTLDTLDTLGALETTAPGTDDQSADAISDQRGTSAHTPMGSHAKAKAQSLSASQSKMAGKAGVKDEGPNATMHQGTPPSDEVGKSSPSVKPAKPGAKRPDAAEGSAKETSQDHPSAGQSAIEPDGLVGPQLHTENPSLNGGASETVTLTPSTSGQAGEAQASSDGREVSPKAATPDAARAGERASVGPAAPPGEHMAPTPFAPKGTESSAPQQPSPTPGGPQSPAPMGMTNLDTAGAQNQAGTPAPEKNAQTGTGPTFPAGQSTAAAGPASEPAAGTLPAQPALTEKAMGTPSNAQNPAAQQQAQATSPMAGTESSLLPGIDKAVEPKTSKGPRGATAQNGRSKETVKTQSGTGRAEVNVHGTAQDTAQPSAASQNAVSPGSARPQSGAEAALQTAPSPQPGTPIDSGFSSASGLSVPGEGAPQSARPAGSTPQPPLPAGGQPPVIQASRMAEDVAVQMARNLTSGVNRFELRLDPPELGRIDIRMEINADGQVQASLSVDRADALDLLRGDARLLERALNEAGLKTENGSLSFNLRQEDGRPETGQGHADRRDSGHDGDARSGGQGPPESGPTGETPQMPRDDPHEELHGLRITVRRGINLEI